MAPPNLGDRIADRYELTAPLRGLATTRTFLALDDQIAVHVAVTWFDPAVVTSAGWAAFARVTAAAAAARVPGLVLPRDLTTTPPDPPHCVAEVPQGFGLDRLRERGAVEWKRALTLGERIVEIVAGVHAATGTAHRALTPARCLCTDRDEVRVLDHGVAELEREHPDEPGYRAPEQPVGEGPRGDIYTVAVILFELIAGQRPRAGIRLRSLVPVPTGVDNLFARALSPDPGQRYPDYALFRGALREALGLPSLQPPAPVSAPEPPRSEPVIVDIKKPPAPVAPPAWARPAPVVPPVWAKPVVLQPIVQEPVDSTLRLPQAARGSSSAGESTEELPQVVRAVAPVREWSESTEVLPVGVRPAGPVREWSESTEVLPVGVRPASPVNVQSDAKAQARAAGNVRGAAAGASSTPLDEQRTVAFTPVSRPRPTPAPVEPPAELARTEVDGVRLPQLLAVLREAAEARPGRPVAEPGAAIERTEPDTPVVPGVTYSAIEGTRFIGDIGPPPPLPSTPEVAEAAATSSEAPVRVVPPPTRAAGWTTQQVLIAVNVVCVVLIVLFVVIARVLG